MRAAPWAGNVRELLNALERATIVVPAGALSPRDLGLSSTPAVRTVAAAVAGPELTWEQNERAYLEQLLDASEGRLYGPGGAAEKSGLKPTTLRSKLVRFGLR